MSQITNITSRLIDLTPELAENLLARNPRNRRYSGSNFNIVKRAVENGEWMVNGEAIKVSVNGYILDGQHRCRAVVETGVTIQTFIIEGLPDETQDTMDTGKSRSLGDILTIRGETSATALAALIKRHMLAELYGTAAAFGSSNWKRPLTNHECLVWLDHNSWVREYVNPGRQIAEVTPMGGSTAGFLASMFDRIDSDDSTFFWARVADGVNLADDSPIYALRKAFQGVERNTKGERNQRYLGALVIKSWNFYRAGEPAKQIRFRVGGANPETFPEPK